ncbi:MAG: GGDEF domain-containing phosphodiesterase [Treponema sp.]|nr:GGDEF domain-containing phosphodiesterase [Treponema sp.]
MNFVYEYDIAAIVTVLAVIFNFYTKKTLNTKSSKSFTVLAFIVLFTSILDSYVYFLIHHPGVIPNAISYVFLVIYYTGFSAIPPAFCYCLLSGNKDDTKKLKNLRKLISLPFLFSFVLILFSPITGQCFYFDADTNYCHGPFYYFLFALGFFYEFFALISAYQPKYQLSKAQKHTVVFYFITNLMCFVIQVLIKGCVLFCFVSSINCLLIYLSIDNPANYKDKETNFFNRLAAQMVLKEAFNKKTPFSVVVFQVIGLKHLNETIGLENKKELLRKISSILSCITNPKSIFKISSSRFIVILPGNSTHQIEHFTSQIKLAFSEPIRTERYKIPISVRICYFLCPEDASNTEDLFDTANSILNELIESEAGTCVRVNKNAIEIKNHEKFIRNALVEAISNNAFTVFYQPVFSWKEQRFTTAEALIRFSNPLYRSISPEEFIPMAEQNGMILQIGTFIFKNVCKFIKQNHLWEKGIDYIHINLSVVQCMQENLAKELLDIMDFYGIDYKYVNLEVTETAAIASSDILKKNMNELIQRNINFSLDDYGSGFANASSLIKYPFHTIKLDKTLVWAAMLDEKVKTIMLHSIKMVKALDMEIVAEGVENEEQRDELVSVGCDFLQGYFYSKPISGEQFLELLEK